MTVSPRHNVWIPDEEWEAYRLAAIKEGAAKGERISTSAWLRQAAREKLALSRLPETPRG